MQIEKKVSEDEVWLSFLKGELYSERFRDDLLQVLKDNGYPEALITRGNSMDVEENERRKKVLKGYRGYPDQGIFANFPKVKEWVRVNFQEADLENIYYLDYSYWNELSEGTSKPLVAAENVKAGREVFGVSNAPFYEAAQKLELQFLPPVILLSSGKPMLLLEGHLRMTAYAMCPDRFTGAEGYVGYCTEEDMLKKEPGMGKRF